MEAPSVVHPLKFIIGGHVLEVVSFAALTDEQAEQIARVYYRSNKFKKKDRGKFVYRVVWVGDADSSGRR